MTVVEEEREFLEALARDPSDRAVRGVYADWLEDRGDPRAAWLRFEDELFDGPPDVSSPATPESRAEHHRRIAELDEVDPEWAASVSRLPIENCDIWSRLFRFRFQCPERWEALETTDEPSVRRCGVCQRNVYYCPSIETAITHSGEGRCVAVAVDVVREQGDLDDIESFLGELEMSDAWPEQFDRESVRPFARLIRAVQQAIGRRWRVDGHGLGNGVANDGVADDGEPSAPALDGEGVSASVGGDDVEPETPAAKG